MSEAKTENTNVITKEIASEMEYWIQSVAKYHSIVAPFENVPPGDRTLLCAWLMGTLAAQEPLAASAFVEGMNMFQAFTRAFLTQVNIPRPPDTIVWIDLKDCNLEDAPRVFNTDTASKVIN